MNIYKILDEVKFYKMLDEMNIYKILDEMNIYKILDEVKFYKILDEMKIYKILDIKWIFQTDVDLKGDLHQSLLTVWPDEVVVGKNALRVVATHSVEEGGEQGQGVPVVGASEVLHPPVAEQVSLASGGRRYID